MCLLLKRIFRCFKSGKQRKKSKRYFIQNLVPYRPHVVYSMKCSVSLASTNTPTGTKGKMTSKSSVSQRETSRHALKTKSVCVCVWCKASSLLVHHDPKIINAKATSFCTVRIVMNSFKREEKILPNTH